MDNEHDTLVVRVEDGIGWLIFNRPQHGNAMNADMLDALPRAWRRLDTDDEVRAIVVTGAGKAFQTGLDVAALAREPASLKRTTRQTREARLELTGWHLGVRTPVIAAVNGTCAGGGLHFVVDADLVIASDTARFSDPHVSVGQASSWEAIGLARRIPTAVAARLALVGRHEYLDAQRALQIGLVGEVVTGPRLRERAAWIAGRIAEQDPLTVRAVKATLWRAQEIGRTDAARTAATGPAHC